MTGNDTKIKNQEKITTEYGRNKNVPSSKKIN